MDLQREHAATAVRISTPEDLAAYVEEFPNWRIAYHTVNLKREFDPLCRAAWMLTGDKLLVVEEVHHYCSPSFIPEPFERIILFGRHAAENGGGGPVSTICVSRRPAEVHRSITSEAWEIYSFNVSEPSALEYLRHYVGDDFTAGLNRLPPLRYRKYSRLEPLAGIQEFELPDPRKGNHAPAVERGA